jgi:CheY-like chemotaxis protein
MVAESHGGYLDVESRVGLGTTVSLVLPLAGRDALSGSKSAAAAGEPLTRTAEVSPTPRHVLVVDDEEAIAEYFRIILAAERYVVTVAASMRAALDEFTPAIDVVLLDMMLGDGSGFDLYRRIRQVRPELPIVVCTGFADNDALDQIRADGHEVLLKPCTRAEVLTSIGRALARGRARRS